MSESTGEKTSATGNISKARRERLIGEVAAIRAFLEKNAGADTNSARLLSFAADLEREVRGKKFGLVFEEHRERVDVELEENIPVLEEVRERFVSRGGAESAEVKEQTDLFTPNGVREDVRRVSDEQIRVSGNPPLNFLIEGDNLAALKLLEKTHRGRIDLIYIDPPYNTGNKDFIYNDSYVDKTDAFRHSKWLSFMRKRLEIAKRLMSDKGVIFISIDDNEQAALKLLCDDVFGFDVFAADISWQRTYSTRNDSKGIVRENEHILVYSKRANWQPEKLPRTEKMDGSFKNPDNDISPWTSSDAFAPDSIAHQSMIYAVQNPFTGKLIYPTPGRHWALEQSQILEYLCGWTEYELRDIGDAPKRAEICGISVDKVRKGVKAIMLVKSLVESKNSAEAVFKRGQWPKFYFTSNGRGGIRRKTYLSDVGGIPPTNLWQYKDVGHTDEAKKELMAIFDGKVPFDTPKPVRLLERILQIASKKGSCILDFFAGSGTTGHAVMKLNAEDGGRRKFILVTNNENGICEKVTYERLRRVIEKEGYAASLKYFRIGYVPIGEDGYWEMADALLGHIRELVELENGIDFAHDSSVAIVLTDEEAKTFVAGISAAKKAKCAREGVRVLYKGHNVMLGAKARAALERLGIEVRTIPDYYYPELEG